MCLQTLFMERSSMKKALLITLKVFIILLIPILMLLYINNILIPKSYTDKGGEKYWQGQTYTAKENGKVEIGFFGSSEVKNGFIPMELYKEYGFSAYNCGVNNPDTLSASGIYRNMEKFINTHHPKMILISPESLYSKNTSNIFDDLPIFYNIYTYHSRWKNLKAKDFFTAPTDANYYDISKGYYMRKDVTKVSNDESYMGSPKSKAANFTLHNRLKIKKMIKLCKKNNIKLAFVVMPTTKNWNYSKQKGLLKLIKKEGIDLIDFNENHMSYGLDYEQDFRDKGMHVNLQGAQKITKYLADYIKAECPSLTDFRETEYSVNLDKALENYERRCL